MSFAYGVGIAAAAGLAPTTVGAGAVHIARTEFAYTWKINTSLSAEAVLAGVLQSLVEAPVIGSTGPRAKGSRRRRPRGLGPGRSSQGLVWL